MIYTIVSIEDGIVSLESQNCDIIRIPLTDFDIDVREGDILKKTNDKFIIDKELTEKRRSILFNKMNSILKKTP